MTENIVHQNEEINMSAQMLDKATTLGIISET